MNSDEDLMSSADRALELLEQKSPNQLAVELAELQRKHGIALSALNKMQDQRDQLAAQLKDATAQCVVSAELLRELREGAEIHLHNCTVCKNAEGVANWTSKLERIDAALSGKMPEEFIIARGSLPELTAEDVKRLQRCGDIIRLPEACITKPARIGGVVFQPGIKVSSVLEAAYLAADQYEPNPAAFQALQDAMLTTTTDQEGK